MKKIFRSFSDLLGLVFPQICVSCGNNLFIHENVICSKCLYHIPRTQISDMEDNMVARLFWGRVSLKYCTAYFYYNKGSKYQNIIHNLKYQGKQYIGSEFGKIFGSALRTTNLVSVDVVVPIPLHARKLRKRGFNQSEVIAKGIAESMDRKMDADALERVVDTDSQTRRSRYQRWENVDGIFKVIKPEVFKNSHILLVDDVVTTGSTIESCASEILKIEGATVSMAALAIARYN